MTTSNPFASVFGRVITSKPFSGDISISKSYSKPLLQTGKHAPYGHKLPTLARKAKLELTQDQIAFLERVTDYNLKARYPDYLFELKKRATRSFTQNEIAEIERYGKWFKSMLES